MHLRGPVCVYARRTPAQPVESWEGACPDAATCLPPIAPDLLLCPCPALPPPASPRYEREFNRGHRPLLKALLQQDELPAIAMVLAVASLHLPPAPSDGSGGGGAGRAPGSGGRAGGAGSGGGGGDGGGMGDLLAVTVSKQAVAAAPPHLLRNWSDSLYRPAHLPPPYLLQLELTDGWYWVRASGDARLTQLVREGRLGQGECGRTYAWGEVGGRPTVL